MLEGKVGSHSRRFQNLLSNPNSFPRSSDFDSLFSRTLYLHSNLLSNLPPANTAKRVSGHADRPRRYGKFDDIPCKCPRDAHKMQEHGKNLRYDPVGRE